MKYLTIIRHAKSSWEHPDLDDFVRPLNDRGQTAIPLIGNYLQQQQIYPDLIISSPATRAIETAKGMAHFLQYDPKKIQVEPLIYFGTSASIISILQQIETTNNDVFLIGHEPKLSYLIFQLAKCSLNRFPTCSAYRIAFDIKKWKELKNGKQEIFITPRQLMLQ